MPPQPSEQPPPPPKVPLDHEDTTLGNTLPYRYNPPNSFSGGSHKHDSEGSVSSVESSKKPRFDPHKTYKSYENKHLSSQKEDQGPSIPMPQFSNFDIKTALPGPAHGDAIDKNIGVAGGRLQNPASYTNQDRRSASATDVSSCRPAASTPESQQTSYTSYKDSEAQAERKPVDEQGNDSFYWHSGRSSSEGEDERSHVTKTAAPGTSRETAQPAVEHEAHGLPTRSTSLSPVPPVTYGASALGLGGPSDWEYFGDYEAEEIDDEDLYIYKPRAELPADYSQVDSLKSISQPQISRIEKSTKERSSAEFRPQTPPPLDQIGEDDIVLESKWSPSTTTPTTPHANSSRPVTVTTEPLPSEDHRPDLEEAIRAWSDAPHIGRSSSAHSTSRLSQRHFHKDHNPAEASLASTPGENVLGIYAAPKDAPPLPKLPDSIDRLSANDHIESTTQSFKDRVIPDLPKDDVTNEQSQDLEKKMEVINPTVKTAETADLASKSSVKIDKTDTEVAFEGTEAVKSIACAKESKKNNMSESNDALKVGSTLQKPRTKITYQSSEALSTEVKVGNSQGKTEDEFSDALCEEVVVEKNQPLADAVTGHLQANRIVPDLSSTMSDTTDALSTGQKCLEPTVKAYYSPTDNPSMSGNTPRIWPDRIFSPESDFARKRSMFESPSDTKPYATPITRKPLKEIRQLAEPNISVSVNETNHISTMKVQSEAIDQKEESLQLTGEKSAIEKPLNKNDDLQRYENSNNFVNNENLMKTNEYPAKILDPTSTSEKEDERSRSTTQQVELRTALIEHSENLPKDKPNRNSHRLSTTSIEELSSKELKDQTAKYYGTSVGERFAPTEGVEIASKEATSFVSKDHAPKTVVKAAEGQEQSEENDHSAKADDLAEVATPRIDVQLSLATTSLDEKTQSRGDLVNDPYADLDPWGKASLNRFAAMLREEARSESNKDKLNIFNVFASRESRLRVVLYGSEDELIFPQKLGGTFSGGIHEMSSEKQKLLHLGKAGSKKKVVQKSNTISTRRSTKELPPLPSNRDSVINLPTNNLTPLVVDSDSKPASSGGLPSHAADSQEYSPGGRPIVERPQRTSEETGKPQLKETLKIELQNGKAIGILQANKHADATDAKNAADEQKPPDSRPRPNKSGSEVNNYLTNRRSVYRPFATQTMESLENAITFGREPSSEIGAPPIPALVAPTSQYNSAGPERNLVSEVPIQKKIASGKAISNQQQLDLRRFVDADFDPLVMVLPESEAVLEESTQFADIQNLMEAIPDDFSFIHVSVVAWDANVKNRREENERQRHARQIESEQRIDALFDDHEIGYGDIGELEGEFKQSEAARKAEEDRYEYQIFIEDVFNLVWSRLHYELDQLIPHYERYSTLMDEALAGKEMFEQARNGLALAPTMTAFLGLHQKLEIRHQKAFEAVLERDRRLKKTEISPWYTLSNIPKVKQLKRQFEDAEKNAIIEYCQQRNQRANRLMDVLDHNTLRGVGCNQDYMEAIMKAVRRIASGRAFASVPGPTGPTEGIELVQKAKAITGLLASSSEQIVQTFHVADMLLNSADYEVSVAKAKMTKADMAELAKLKEERAKEDQKLMRDLEHRLALIREDSRRTNDEIVKLILFLGVHNGKAVNAQPVPSTLGLQHQESGVSAQDPDHEARIQKALEEATKRNAEQDGHE